MPEWPLNIEKRSKVARPSSENVAQEKSSHVPARRGGCYYKISQAIQQKFRSLVQAPNAPQDQSQHPRARNDHDEETAYES